MNGKKRRRFSRTGCVTVFCLTLLLGYHVPSFGQTKASSRIENFYQSESSTNTLTPNDTTYYLVEFKRDMLANKYLATNTRVVRNLGNGKAIVFGLQVKDSAKYHSVHAVNHLWKLSNPIEDFEAERKRTKTYTLILRQDKKEGEVRELLPQIKIRHVRNISVLIECSFEDILKYVLPLQQVVYVGLESREPVIESRVLDLNLSANGISYVNHAFPMLNGEGFTLSVKENSFNGDDVDLKGRVLSSTLASSTVDLHATEMATIAGGSGYSFVTGRGVARNVTLTSSDFIRLEPDSDNDLTSQGVSVQNHSYGTTIENFYGALAKAYDESAVNNPTLVHVFSSGNDGLLASTSGTYAGLTGFANLTGNFKMAKNILVVGSVDTVGREVSFSSRGPAYDGRVKPELVAYSTAGSSNSAAIVSGMAVLLQQAYKSEYGELPSSALVRALLVNGARDVGRKGIDFVTGYGNADLRTSLAALQKGNFVSGIVSNSQTQNFSITIPENARNLKVTLTWNDPAAQANDEISLVNDLDVKLISPGGATTLPWKLNSSASVTALSALPERAEDHLNTIEQITLEDLPAGDYALSIHGFSVQSGSQDFYVAYEWEMEEMFSWTYPTGSDNFPYNGEAGTYFQWVSTLAASTGKLEYSLDQGASWTTIKEGVDLSTGLLRWDAPQVTAMARARMVVGSAVYVTDNFTISRPLTIGVGFNCTDSLMLNWKKAPGVDRYRVQAYTNASLETIGELQDTSLILYKVLSPATFYTVRGIFPESGASIQGYLVDYIQQGVTCYLSSFYCISQGEEGILLKLQIGTIYQVKQLIFERQEGSTFTTIASLQDLTNSEIDFLDEQPLQGLNTYRVRIQFTNGEEIVSNLSSDYYLTEISFLLFPNPIRVGDDLQIIAKQLTNQQVQLDFYKQDGAKVFTQQLYSDREFITIPPLATGLYLYTITSEEGVSRGRLIVL